jgi:hypothetical protein
MLPRYPLCRRWFPIRGSSSGKRPVVEQTVAASRSESPIKQWRTEHPDYFRDTYAL